ncbi:Lrp/AsnC family transcriptional regulator [Candidatus Pacearchaeota archaeon]|nr:Lrp/AsnC family transcriptional regulator [Candidatus Pacearchaeota archaeon]
MVESQEFKIDLKDKKILYELDKDCRQACSEIGKKVGLSSEVVNYRIKRLEDEKIITQYQLAIDLSKLGIIQFKVLLSFQKMDSHKLSSLVMKLEKNKNVKWIISCKGNWDMAVAGEGKTIEEINSVKNEILSAFGNYILNKSVSICTGGEVYNRDYLVSEKANPNRTRILVSNLPKAELDELDMKILLELSENAIIPIVNIAYKLKESERVVNYRIRQLIKRKIIIGFRIALDYEKVGIKFYKTFVYLENPQVERIKDLLNYLRNQKNIIHNLQVVGNWDLEPEFEVYSEKEFDSILQDMKDKFSDIIKKIDILTISREHKFVYL